MLSKDVMPFVQIHLAQHFTEPVKQAISQVVHESLMEIFHVPKADFFQVIHVLPPSHLLYPDSYLDVPHTNNLLYVYITCAPGRTPEMKQALYAAIANGIAQRAPITADDVIIILNESAFENWSFGQGKAQMLHRG